MATEEQRARRRAQRELAKNVKSRRYTPVIPKSFKTKAKAAVIKYANDVIAGREPYPKKGTAEARSLARLASQARHGDADPKFEAAFRRYWYKERDQSSDSSEDSSYEDSEGESSGEGE